jgi:CheY-like chemotaxis protein
VASLKCPKCKGKIEIDTRERDQEPPAETAPDAPVSEAGTASEPLVSPEDKTSEASSSQAAAETFDAPPAPDIAFGFVEEGVKTALLCEEDAGVSDTIASVLKKMEYSVTLASSTREALKFIRFHSFDMIVINETFDGGSPTFNHVLKYLEQFPISVRRDIFVLLVGSSFRTGDDMVAFHRSVNFVVDLKSMYNFDKILKRALREHDDFYRMLKESMVKTGRV